jgi:hypothetical protein
MSSLLHGRIGSWLAFAGAIGLVLAFPGEGLAQAAAEAPPPEFTTWSWPKRIAFVVLIMGCIVIVSNTLGKYQWPEEWGGRHKPGARPIVPELPKQRSSAGGAYPNARGEAPDAPDDEEEHTEA